MEKNPDIRTAIRDYWDRQPCNSRHSNLDPRTPEYWQAVTEKKYRAEPHIPAFADHRRYANLRVLEVGCGIGTDAEQFARAGADYTGIDISAVSIELCKQRFQVLNLPGRFYQADAERLRDHALGEFDLIYSFGVLHHTPNPQAAIAEIYHALRPGAEFKLMLYAHHSWKRILISAGLAQPEAQTGCPLALTYTPDQAAELLQAFSAVQIRQDHIWPWQVEPYKQNHWVREPWFAHMPTELFQALERELGWHLLIQAVK